MSNVLALPMRRHVRSVPDPAAALAALATSVAKICQMQFRTKRDMEQAILLLDRANVHSRELIEQIDEEARKAPLLAHSDRIQELVELARREVAAL